MTDTRFADISEFQSNINADAYINGGYRILLCRVHNGYRPDRAMPSRAAYLRTKNFTSLGWYQYLAKDRDPVEQAYEFVSTVGRLRSNEFPILDLEEGAGNQVSRAETWFRVIDSWAKFAATLYSGEAFLASNLGGAARWGRRPLWVAKYGSGEPRCTFWQYTDSACFPGLVGGVDGSLYHGTATQFASRVRPGVTPQPEPRVIAAQDTITVTLPGGKIEVFVEKAGGEVMHRWQDSPGSAQWSTWSSLGTPGG